MCVFAFIYVYIILYTYKHIIDVLFDFPLTYIVISKIIFLNYMVAQLVFSSQPFLLEL